MKAVSDTGLLGLVLVTAKLTGFTDFPWALVLAPYWAPLAFHAVIFLMAKSIRGKHARRNKS